MKKANYFTKAELWLWLGSLSVIIISFAVFDRSGYVTLAASLIGVTSLIFCAKGNPLGMVLMILFSIVYGAISMSVKYYGEMITYVGMTLPMSVFALVSWLKNPYKGNKSQVTVGRLNARDVCIMFALAGIVTLAFYFILEAFGTANLIASTVSVTTSFLGAYLTFKRSAYFALAYAANDVVLIVLWIMAAAVDFSYFSVLICFAVFLINDIYGFVNWRKMTKKQA